MNSNTHPTHLVYQLMLTWQLQLVQPDRSEGVQIPQPRDASRMGAATQARLPKGRKALIYLRGLLPARMLSKAMKARVDETEVCQLLRQSWMDPTRTIQWHNRVLGCTLECETILSILMQYRKPQPRLPQPLIHLQVPAIVNYYPDGSLRSLSEGMTELLSQHWSKQWQRTRTLIEDRPHHLLHRDFHDRSRSVSEPHHVYACRPSRKPRRMRSDSPSFYEQE
jgi:hypothetical protein